MRRARRPRPRGRLQEGAGSLRRLASLAALALLAVWPAAARADLEIVVKDLPSTGHTLLAQDTSAEGNFVSVSVVGPQRWAIHDRAGITSFPGECTRPLGDVVLCDATSFAILDFELGAGDDVIQPIGDYHGLGLPNQLVDLGVALGDGNDTFLGADGDQFVTGGPGRDRLIGGSLLDRFIGGSGRDVLKGGEGRDDLFGRGGRDVLVGGPGRKDLMVGGKGRDRCTGDPRDLVAGCERVKVEF